MSLLTTASPEECIRTMSTDPWKLEYVEFSCLYPYLGKFYMEWEKDTDYWWLYNLMEKYPRTPIVAVIIYGLAIYAGKRYMKDKEPFQWRKTMALWNLFLSLYSFAALVRVFPPLAHSLTTASVRENLCRSAELFYGRGSTGFWTHTFVWSKFFELFDTLFIIVHKKPLIFLHWYHHVTVLLFTWDAYMTRAPGCPIFMSMNCAVHFIMYGYYFFMTIKMKPKWMDAMIITICQISQMIVGVWSMIMSIFYVYGATDDDPCFGDKRNLLAAVFMYASYLFLFLQFFVKRYFKGRGKIDHRKKD